ncbi:MAG: winged helix-turn-helix transcriptional regulator [Campylobacterales bacterium]|nr:winged helix-turn-helix transcriptional regulator [Campylobacterales bacterium]
MSLCFLSLETSKVFNKLILNNLTEAGYDGLSDALIILFPYIDDSDGITSAQLAKEVGYTRQAMHKNIKKLEELGYVKLLQYNLKKKVIVFTQKGKKLMEDANSYILQVERELSNLVGEEELQRYKKTQIKLHDYLNTLQTS